MLEIMKGISLTWSDLFTFSPCPEALIWGKEKYKEKETQDSLQIIKDLMEDKKFDWANWLIVRLMTRPQYLAYAIFAAEQVIDIYEKKHPKDNRPRQAIEAAKKVLENDNEENRKIAFMVADAAYSAYAADAAYSAYAAAYSAYAAAYVAYAAAYVAYAAAHAASAAYAVASLVPNSVYKIEEEKMQIKILNYGIELMKKEK